MVKIFIDPGHGGTDPGAVGNGLLEKMVTLSISKRIRDMLTGYENVQIKLSREEDLTLSLKQRTDMANSWGADYLLSVHINAGGGTGYEDFIYPGSGGVTAVNQNAIHEEIMKQIDMIDRGKKQANLHMLRESKMPAILTENGFIDNPSDAAKLKQAAYIDKIVQGHVNGLVKVFGLKKKEEPKMADENKEVSSWAKASVEKARNKKDKNGTPIMNVSNPKGNVTEEQMAVILDRLGLLD